MRHRIFSTSELQAAQEHWNQLNKQLRSMLKSPNTDDSNYKTLQDQLLAARDRLNTLKKAAERCPIEVNLHIVSNRV